MNDSKFTQWSASNSSSRRLPSGARKGSAARTLTSIVAEYESVRAATLTLFEGFDEGAWAARGCANGAAFTVASLPWIVLGHDLHHAAVLTERYGLPAPA